MSYNDLINIVQKFVDLIPFVNISRNAAQMLVVIFIFICLDVSLSLAKRKVKREYSKSKEEKKTFAEIESASVNYFSSVQMLDLTRFISLVIGLFCVLVVYDFQIMTYFAVAVGALFIVFKEVINSVAMYFYVMSTYKIGEDIKIEDLLGEIVRIRPSYVQLAGKDSGGEYNGKQITIPSYLFMQKTVEKQELSSSGMRKISLSVVYAKESFGLGFGEWLIELRQFLDSVLQTRTMRQVGNFKNFAGMKYRLKYDYNQDGLLVVNILFISEPGKVQDTKEKIVAHIEEGRIRSSPMRTV